MFARRSISMNMRCCLFLHFVFLTTKYKQVNDNTFSNGDKPWLYSWLFGGTRKFLSYKKREKRSRYILYWHIAHDIGNIYSCDNLCCYLSSCSRRKSRHFVDLGFSVAVCRILSIGYDSKCGIMYENNKREKKKNPLFFLFLLLVFFFLQQIGMQQ